jgi:outer membrane beta-barrel protein
MNLGFRQRVDREKVAKSRLTGLFAVLCALGWPAVLASSVAAQDMSFDLDEAESAEAEGGGEADAEFSLDEAEGEAELEGEGEAEAGGGGGDDLFDELTDDSGVLDEEPKDAAPRQKEAAEEIYAVQRMYVLRNGRFELAPSLATTFNDQYVSHPALSVGLNYWVTNVLAIGANFLWFQGIESESDLNFSIRRSTRLAVPISEYQLGGNLNFTYVPIYGKFTMFNDAIFQWDSYVVGGVGMIRTRPVAVVDPAVRSFDFDWRVSFNAGIGIRVFVTKYLTVFGELRDYIYLEKLENLDVALGAAREDENTWIDEDATLTNNVMVHLGLTLFFPFTFDYRYPK